MVKLFNKTALQLRAELISLREEKEKLENKLILASDSLTEELLLETIADVENDIQATEIDLAQYN